jgi:hypothetical protein
MIGTLRQSGGWNDRLMLVQISWHEWHFGDRILRVGCKASATTGEDTAQFPMAGLTFSRRSSR